MDHELSGAPGRVCTRAWQIVLARLGDTVTSVCMNPTGMAFVINLTGALGVGKTSMLRAWACGDQPRGVPVLDLEAAVEEDLRLALTSPSSLAMGLDSVDGPNAALLLEHLTSAARSRPTPVVVAASRRPLRAQPGWARAATLVTLPVPPWPDAAVARLAGALGIEDPARRELVVRLSAGIPLVAECLCRSLHAQHPAAVPAAMADEAVREILARLRREGPHHPGVEALGTLASVGHSDEELLEQLAGGAGAEAFAALGALSVVAPSRHGLVVLEPYRTLFDLAHQWRHPIAHRTALTRATAHSRRLLAAARDQAVPTELARHCLFLTGDPLIREHLFPTTARTPQVRPMAAGDEDAVARLLHDWARRRDLDRRNCARMLDGWLAEAAEGFHLVCTNDGTPAGMVNTLPVNPRTIPTLEPLLELHTERLTRPPSENPAQPAGVFGGFLVCDQGGPAAYAALLHHVLAASIQHGRLLVATPWPGIEALVRRLGFTYHGQTRYDVYACGRKGQIFSQQFAPDDLPRWLDTLGALGIPAPLAQDRRRLRTLVRQALEHLDDSAALAGSPLLALPAIATVDDLRSRLTEAIQALAGADTPVRAEAGQVLTHCYLRRRTGHDMVAYRLHLSRATYYRRLGDGLTAVARHLWELPPEPAAP